MLLGRLAFDGRGEGYLDLIFRAGLIFRINEGGFELDDCAREGGGEMPTSKPEECHANSNENAGSDSRMTAQRDRICGQEVEDGRGERLYDL
jgi:hypothetical protein